MYRTIRKQIIKSLNSHEVLILLGPRQVGKTTLLKDVLREKAIYIDIDDKIYREFFDSLSVAKYRSYIESNLGSFRAKQSKIILILDEAQRLKDPGLTGKLFYDQIENVKVILTGSSTLDIKKKTSESLAGRKTTIYLFPLSFQEFLVQKDILKISSLTTFEFLGSSPFDEIKSQEMSIHLQERMRVGLYPGIFNTNAETYLQELIESVILKDIFYLNLIKNTTVLLDLLKTLASLIGQDINTSDLSKRLGIARKTVADYLTILEKSYIIFTLPPYKKKRDDEISKFLKIYFYDLGIRNALLNDFRPVHMRNDYEQIFKNFIIAEFRKLNIYYQKRFLTYYWRTTQGSEVDLILEKDMQQNAFAIKLFQESFSKGFENTYPEAHMQTITLNNFLGYII